jgi:SAM-dependent methyltransferase
MRGQSSRFRDFYSKDLPTPANAFRIFGDEWTSSVPGFETGNTPLFQDDRIKWVQSQLGSFQNKRVLEIGPLEGGHSWMMEQAGANVVSIEANQRGFLKCLVVKNALNMKCEFLYGDCRPYLAMAPAKSFDLVLAIGVLYHMLEPAKLLHDIARATNCFALWTHYYDRDILGPRAARFDSNPQIQIVEGMSVQVHQQNYFSGVKRPGFCGGTAPISFWLSRSSLLDYIQTLGFGTTIGSEDRDHPNGPCILLIAKRKR